MTENEQKTTNDARATADAAQPEARAKEIALAYCVNVQGQGAAQFCDQLLASVYSARAAKSEGESITVYVLYHQISPDLVVQIGKLQRPGFRVEFARITDHIMQTLQRFSRHNPMSQIRTWSGIVYARIFLPLMLSGLDRVIYLDADTLVRSSLAELWDTDLGGKSLGMNMGLTPEYGYNSGVILMDLKRMREKTDWQKLLGFMEREAASFYCPDQTVINRFFVDEIKPIGRKFNYAPIAGARDREGMTGAVVWHWYNGHCKPQAMGREDVGISHLAWQGALDAAIAEASGGNKTMEKGEAANG